MGTTGWGAESSLADRLLADACEFDFFQAVRLLLRLMPDKLAVGEAAKPPQEVVRLHSRVSLEFPASAIHEIESNGGAQPGMTVAFLGLMGIQGVLPVHYTERMLLRKAAHDETMAAFLDIFNHRLLSLFYKAWEKHRLPMAFERSSLERDPPYRLNHYLLNFVGLGTAGLERRQAVRDETWLRYAGLVAQRPRSASSLRGVLRDYFGVPFEIEQFVGAWYTLDDGDRCYLDRPGLHNQLGIGAIAGDAVWDQQSRIRVRIGPLSYARFCEFLPGARSMRVLTDMIRFLLGTSVLFDVQLVLRKLENPRCRLQSVGGPRLGWDSWLTETFIDRDLDDAMFAEAA